MRTVLLTRRTNKALFQLTKQRLMLLAHSGSFRLIPTSLSRQTCILRNISAIHSIAPKQRPIPAAPPKISFSLRLHLASIAIQKRLNCFGKSLRLIKHHKVKTVIDPCEVDIGCRSIGSTVHRIHAGCWYAE